MTWNKTLTYKHSSENTRELHIQNVYNDPEFTFDLSIVAVVGNEIDKALLQDFRVVDLEPDLFDGESISLQDIADKYFLTLDEVVHFVSGLTQILPLPRETPFKVNWNEYDDKDHFNVSFTTDIKKGDFMQIWELIKRKQSVKHGGKKSKNKAVENDLLIYSIFKARMNNEKFSHIFAHYAASSLNGYTGSTNQFTSEESLERYYNKYKPSKVE